MINGLSGNRVNGSRHDSRTPAPETSRAQGKVKGNIAGGVRRALPDARESDIFRQQAH